jgi:hypothetical protein
MELLGNLFDKYRHLEVKGQALRFTVAQVIMEVTKINIDPEAILIKGTQIMVKLASKQKIVVLIHREEIINRLHTKLNNGSYKIG